MRCASNRGFTLLEVLAALLLVAIVLPVLMGALNTATHVGGLAHDRAEAAMLAENKLTEILIDQSWQFGDDTGTFDTDADTPAMDRYTWELYVEQWQDPSVRKLTMTVRWERRGRPQSITLTTAVHDGGNA
jgi:general secretion pathway protein I